MHTSLGSAVRVAALIVLVSGCATTLDKLPVEALDIRLDTNSADDTYGPHKRGLGFLVKITNQSGGTISPEKLRVELRAYRAGYPETIALKQSWTYSTASDKSLSGTGSVRIGAGKSMSIPIYPERRDPNATAVDFPLKLLPEGKYEIVAVINDRYLSKPCVLRIERPDLKLIGRPR